MIETLPWNVCVVTYLQIQACILEPKSPYKLWMPSGWHAHQAAQVLISALSKLLLPDVSHLPLPEVAELKEKVKDQLDPMRAEMLRLTEQLRAVVKEERSSEVMAREAENLIITRVEPIVREAAKHTEEVMKSRWKKLLRGALKFIG